MYQEEFSQEPELRDRIVAGSSGLETFLSGDANSYVSLLDHSDVVCSVANGQCDTCLDAFSDVPDETGFLGGRRAAADDRVCQNRQFIEDMHRVRVFADLGQCLSVDHDDRVGNCTGLDG